MLIRVPHHLHTISNALTDKGVVAVGQRLVRHTSRILKRVSE